MTGGTGLLGNSVIRELLSRDESVRALCRKGTDHEPFQGLDVEIVEGDLSCADAIEAAIQGCDAAIHCAAQIHLGWRRLDECRKVNVAGTRALVEGCKKHGARLIHVSTVDTLPAAVSKEEPIDESAGAGVAKVPCSYVISKREAEQVVTEAISSEDLDAVILHPGLMMGPYDWKPSSGRMLLEVSKAPVAIAPTGGGSVCDARDVARAIVNAITMASTGENYVLAGENLTYVELWRKILKVTGKRKSVIRMGPVVRVVGKLIDCFTHFAPSWEGDINGASMKMGSLLHYYSSAKAEKCLEYSTRDVDQSLTDAWKWLMSRTTEPAEGKNRNINNSLR